MKRIFLCLFIIILLITSCGFEQVEEQTREKNPETDFQTEYCDLAPEAHPIVEVQDGYYMMVGAYLYYIDKETMDYTPVCNKPNCLHQKETDQTKTASCNAMFQISKFYTSLNYYKGNLYIAAIENEWRDGLPEQKYVMNQISLDGKNRKTIHEFERPVEMAIVHRGYIYYSSAYAELGSEAAGVYRVPIDGGEEEILYTSDSNKNQLTHLRIIENALIFTEYEESQEKNDCLWKYDLAKEKLEKISFEEDTDVFCANVANDKIYYRANHSGKDQTISTNLEWSDPKQENFVAYYQDDDYYYVVDLKDYTQTVYDWKTNEEITKLHQLVGMGSFYAGKNKLFWICLNEEGGRTVSYIDRGDIGKGDSAVKVIMELSSSETYPGVVTVAP